MSVNIKQFAAGNCYSYIISSGGEAAIVDPHISLANEYDAYIKRSRLSPKAVIDTHTHADHFSLAAYCKKKYGVPVFMHDKAVSAIADRRVKDGDVIPVRGLKIKVIYAPGHTDDTINLSVAGAVFTADVLLIKSIGRTDFQNGSPESMFDTLQKLKGLPDDTVVYPGHDYNRKRRSTIKIEKEANPFLTETDRVKFSENMRSKKLAKPLNMDNIVRANQNGATAAIEMVLPKEAYDLISKDPRAKFLDVRTPSEIAEVRIKDALSIPLDTLQSRLSELAGNPADYILVCRTGNRATMAADMLVQSGMKKVRVLEGGMDRWEKERLPVLRERSGISIERQVRIAAGLIVSSGILLSWCLHPAFIVISLFVGCGLVYAGVTDNCMMGMLLMKLPYNRRLYKPKSGGGTCSVS